MLCSEVVDVCCLPEFELLNAGVNFMLGDGDGQLLVFSMKLPDVFFAGGTFICEIEVF